MPLYEYRCQACDRVVEVLQKISDPPRRKCGECGGRLEKLVSQSGFVLKGAGWYVHEYGRKGKSDAKDAGETPAAPKETAEKTPKTPSRESTDKAAVAG